MLLLSFLLVQSLNKRYQSTLNLINIIKASSGLGNNNILNKIKKPGESFKNYGIKKCYKREEFFKKRNDNIEKIKIANEGTNKKTTKKIINKNKTNNNTNNKKGKIKETL